MWVLNYFIHTEAGIVLKFSAKISIGLSIDRKRQCGKELAARKLKKAKLLAQVLSLAIIEIIMVKHLKFTIIL